MIEDPNGSAESSISVLVDATAPETALDVMPPDPDNNQPPSSNSPAMTALVAGSLRSNAG
jgi:hypothetical protein